MKTITIQVTDENYDKIVAMDESRGRWRAERDGKYWFLSSDGEVPEWIDEYSWGDDYRHASGNYHKTPALAMQAKQRQLALVRVQDYALKHVPFEPDWGDDEQYKYNIYYAHHIDKLLLETFEVSQASLSLPYFKSKSDAEQFIENNKEDLLFLFDVKEEK